MWVSATIPGEGGAPAASLIFARAMGTDQWQQLYQIASPIASLTHQSGEPLILLSNGQWMFVYQDGRSLGTDVPAGGQLAQLTGNGKPPFTEPPGSTAVSRPPPRPHDLPRLPPINGDWCS